MEIARAAERWVDGLPPGSVRGRCWAWGSSRKVGSGRRTGPWNRDIAPYAGPYGAQGLPVRRLWILGSGGSGTVNRGILPLRPSPPRVAGEGVCLPVIDGCGCCPRRESDDESSHTRRRTAIRRSVSHRLTARLDRRFPSLGETWLRVCLLPQRA